MPVSELLVPPAPPLEELDSLYPLETDEPMTSSRTHYYAMVYAESALAHALRGRECLVAADYAFYYQQLEPGEPGPGPSVTPDLVMEMSSVSTYRQDQFRKHGLYAELGIREYWMYDPHGGYLEPRLQGFRLEGREYRELHGELRADLGAEVFPSSVLETFWGRLLETEELRLWIAERDAWFLPNRESEAEQDRQTLRGRTARLRERIRLP